MASFRFFGVNCNVHPSFLLIVLVFTGLYRDLSFVNVILGLMLTVSLLVHEYGHAFAAIYFGAKPEINLEGFGGTTSYRSHLTEKQEFIVTLCGPLIQTVLIIIPFLILKFHFFENDYVNRILYSTMKMNIFWVIFNLLPIIPLDGGKIARYFFERFCGDNWERMSLLTGVIVAIAVSPYYFFEGFYVFGSLLFFYGLKQLQAYQAGVGTKNSNPYELYNKGKFYLQNNDNSSAKRVFKRLLKCKEKSIRIDSLESLTKILCKENKEKEAYQLLSQVNPDELIASKCLLCKLAYKFNHFTVIEKYSREIYEIEPTFEIALLNSKAFACLNQPVLAAGWLKTASMFKQLPRKELEGLVSQKVYDGVRRHEDFHSLFLEINTELAGNE